MSDSLNFGVSNFYPLEIFTWWHVNKLNACKLNMPESVDQVFDVRNENKNLLMTRANFGAEENKRKD